MKEIIITSSVLILCIMLIRHFFKGKIGSRLQYALWLVVAVRLIVPVTVQACVSLGALNELRVMALVEDLEASVGDITDRLEQPISFTMNMDSLLNRQIAKRILAEDMEPFDTADGPTSVFLAGRIGVTWLHILQGIWRGGMGIMAVWMLTVNLRFRHQLRKERCEFQVPEAVRDHLHVRLSGKLSVPEQGSEQDQRAGKRRKRCPGVKIYTVRHLVSPCLYGLPGREAVYLPEKITEEEEGLRHVLTHELCHKRHGDSFWSLLRNVLVAVYWFNPLVWAAAVLSKRDCELACDEEALLFLEESERLDYGRTLLSIISGRRKLADLACMATTMTGSGKSVKERINRIAEKPRVLGVAVTAALMLVLAVSVLVFTNSPRFYGGTWEEGEIYVMTQDKRIVLPDTIAGISGYAEVAEDRNDLIVYQIASDREVGRFCTVSYGEAMELVDAGRSIIPLGNYGANTALKRYMGILEENVVHTYIPVEEGAKGYREESPDAVPRQSKKAPFSFDGKTEWIDDGSNQSAKKPFAFDGQSEWGIEEQPEKITEGMENGVPGTDSNHGETTYLIEDAIENLPSDSIEQVYIPAEDCYLYLTADHTGLKEKYLEEMLYIDGELKKAASQVIVTGINYEVTEKTFEALAENSTRYVGDNTAVLALVNALPFPEALTYGGIGLTTGDTQKKSLRIDCCLAKEGEDLSEADHDLMFFDAVMLFASIENLEECVFAVKDGEDILVEETAYTRDEATERMGVESLWKDLEGEALCSWLEELYQRVLSCL